VLLAYVPRLPSEGAGLTSGSARMTPGTSRRLRIFATTQIAFSFVLLTGAGMLVTTLIRLQSANTGYNMRQVIAFDVPLAATGLTTAQTINYREATRRIRAVPGVDAAAFGNFVPWRDA